MKSFIILTTLLAVTSAQHEPQQDFTLSLTRSISEIKYAFLIDKTADHSSAQSLTFIQTLTNMVYNIFGY
jgi:hypothetical protein